MTAPRHDHSDWLTLEQAAAELAASPRTIRRMIARGELQSAGRPRHGRKPETVVHPGDVDRIRAARTKPFLALTPPGQSQPAHQQHAGAQEFSAGILRGLAAIAAATAPPPPLRPWLTLDEASKHTGLSVRFLRRLIRAGQLPYIRDGKTKVRRADLDNLDTDNITSRLSSRRAYPNA